jgi:hypothetical protein
LSLSIFIEPGKVLICQLSKKFNSKNKISLNGGIKMKKIVVIALIATMLIGMLVFSACKSKETQEQLPDTTLVDTTQVQPEIDTTGVETPVTNPQVQ